ncbi:hypothetical protein SPRG_04258 [Saprolegnia parasitica CBS 223.65]|uniref:Sel1 repeat family protein n=1 Tax=Saprolegnia parasitica (strain CBS 223.65) TaxID=695850 RepID=A0A067CK60_SAPPC|nr:hypothetical protein SPRG_04258 [Saprolegnia parasitica CBS 223.65]KDO31119.1 hypothetical protein SPRG_04258 [Saprolegnia parasitica CBS 223.65]|eukprot:XP_012198248.1 hypothetical protein SPRG_04258 [Saprolegnia parasitica CBS 223.65]
MFRQLLRNALPATGLMAMGAAMASTTSCEAPAAFTAELRRLRANEKDMTARWVKDEEGWRQLPSRVWPVKQPNADQLATLQKGIASMCSTRDPRCNELRFDLATLNVFNNLDTEAGYHMYVDLASEGDVDGLVAVGMCLVEGYGVEQDYAMGIECLQRASACGHPQADYELGVLYYTGAAGSDLPEDEEKALECFERALANGKFSYAAYMVADLLFQNAPVAEYGRALQLMYLAAENGHRFARQEIQAFVEGKHRAFKKL